MEGKSASFSFNGYNFDEIRFSANMIDRNKPVNINFEPSCIFSKDKSEGNLNLKVAVSSDGKVSPFCMVSCNAAFVFNDVSSIEDIPDYFYTNSIAIVYPYIRAMVSLMSVQANVGQPIVLPVLNLTPLKETLKQNTREE